MVKPVGFDQKVMVHHLDYTANESRKLTRKEMYEMLDYYLRSDIQGAKSRKNAITMLMKIWYLVEDGHKEIRDQALELFPQMTKDERMMLHWGMTILAYPFFRDVILEMGSLYRLQDEIPAAVIGKKMKELYGDRRRVEVATSAVLMSMKQWGSIDRQKNRSYTREQQVVIESNELLPFIVEIVLKSSNVSAMPIDMIQNHSLFFPFSFHITVSALKKHPQFRVERQGTDMVTVELTS